MHCTRELFYQTVESPEVAQTIASARAARAQGDERKYQNLKKRLPAFCFMGTFMPSHGKNGNLPEGMWRLQSQVRLNGLVMHDFDHLGEKGLTPYNLFKRIPAWMLDDKSCAFALLFAARTPSGDGLRLVTMADPQRGDIAQNQQHIASILGTECDESVKNADRMSFAVTKDDIIYINDLIFTYENPEYDRRFGDCYRGHVQLKPTPTPSRAGGELNNSAAESPQAVATPRPSRDDTPSSSPEGGEVAALEFNGVPFQSIVDKWIEERGVPAEGTRHLTMLRLAGDLRYICDNDPAKVKKAVRLAAFVRDIEQERGSEEVDNACEDACERKMYMSIPRNFNAILEKLGATKALPLWGAGGGLRGLPPFGGTEGGVYASFWERLKPLLTSPYKEACSLTDDYNKLGAVMAAGGMFCTLMTRCWYEHFNGDRQRMNPQVYIIGMPAAGKSFADRLDSIIMGPMQAADRVGREAEAEYNRKLKERQTSSKELKGSALKKPELMVRYCLSKTSNAVLFHRMRNAHEQVDGEEMHLHLYTFDSELDANTKAQSGGTWIDKHDVELKAFHNERTGVDFSNVDSANGVYEVYYNTVCTGTPLSLNRKINIRNVNDGLCSRIAFFRMVPDGFKMIAKGSRTRNHDLECCLKQWAFRFDSMKGELKVQKLVDHVYSLCEQSAWEAEASGDRVLDFLRKRAVFYATWFTIPRIYGRQWDAYQKTGEVEVDDSDLQFATLMYEAVIYWQDHFFGRMLQESWDNAEQEYKPRKHMSANDAVFAQLKNEFTTQDVIGRLNISKGGACAQLNRWVAQGLCERTAQGRYKKKIGAAAV